MTKEELVPLLARELFQTDIIVMEEDMPINWGRTSDGARGYQTEIAQWEALARTAFDFLYERL